MLATGFDQVPGLAASLGGGAHVLELAAGTGRGLVRIAAKYPHAIDTNYQMVAGLNVLIPKVTT